MCDAGCQRHQRRPRRSKHVEARVPSDVSRWQYRVGHCHWSGSGQNRGFDVHAVRGCRQMASAPSHGWGLGRAI
eukprot:4531973-Prymnesium_polylepis.1